MTGIKQRSDLVCDIFNVIGTFAPATPQSPRTIHITAAAHLFILHPDLLTTATALSTASQCRRKPLLSGLRCLLEGRWEEAFVERCIADAVHGALGDLVKLGLSVDIAKREKNGAMTNTRMGKDDAPALLAITKLLGIEEDIWSPTYGLKGKMTPRRARARGHGAPAQTLLYTLLLSERYGADVQDGLLFYSQSEDGAVVRVPRGRNEIRALIGVRNEWRRGGGGGSKVEEKMEVGDVEHFLPPPIDEERACARCYALDTARTKNRPSTPDPALPAGRLPREDGAPYPAQTAFFRTWEALLALEERDCVERERRGRCWGGMVLRSLDDRGDADAELEELEPGAGEWGVENQRKIHRYTYAFRRARAWDALPTPTQGGDASSLLHGHLGVGDPVTVSVEPNMLALARGYILRLDPAEVELGARWDEVVFRIDKDELFGGMARVRGNLAQLFYADGDRKRLELVVDLRKPVFRDAVEPPLVHPSSPSSRRLLLIEGARALNPSQLGAMEHVLRAEDYALVLGMPGTGKTTVIAALIRELVGRGKTVLLSSYTHSAVDTILMRLAEEEGGFGILRLGNVDKVHPDARKTATTVEQFELQIMAPPVVATTCLTIDQCVKNPEARKGGLDVSLFRRLSEAHPEAVVDLRFQYRMNADIMLLSNRLIYDDRLRCGNEAVARASLALGDRGFLGRLHPAAGACVPQEACWLEKLVDESCKAVFVDTDALPAAESRVGDLVQNTIEAELVRQLTETLLQCGVQESQIGIISLYRQQVKVLHHLLQERKGVEILTADKSQGRDKECIIISLVRSNDGGHIGDLVKDWRRMNVSFTRARKKLVIFGSRTTLQREPLLASFFELMEKQRWIVALSPNAHTAHATREVLLMRRAGGTAERCCDGCGKKAGAGVLKGRPILRDLVGHEM
ncbi:Dna2-domain-containing protein [Pholiota molesta]|nr:Dna2-domain-containing protein [Pholiota molesta]